MDNEDIHGKTFLGFGQCIYCGSDGGTDGLRSEHIMPYSLGGNTEILEASCTRCEGKTSYLDGYLARAVFYNLRVHAGVQSRSGYLPVLPAEVALGGEKTTLQLPAKDHPYFLHMPVWKLPGILMGEQPSDDYGSAKSHVFYYIPPTMRETLGLKHGEVAEIRDATKMPNLKTFARALAKIAYCHAVMKFGLNDFHRFNEIPQLIFGNYLHAPYFVGCESFDPPPPSKRNQMQK